MSKLSLRAKLGAGFLTLIAIMAVTGLVTHRSVQQISELTTYRSKVEDCRYLATKIGSIINDQKAEYRAYLLVGQQAELDRYHENDRALEDQFSKLEANLTTEKGRELLTQLRQASTSYHDFMREEMELRRASKQKQAIDLMYSPKADAVRNELKLFTSNLAALQEQMVGENRAQQSKIESQASAVAIWLAVAGLIVGFSVAVLVIRSITRSLAGMVTMIQEIAANNLGIDDMHVASQDEIGKAAAALNGMKNNLREMIRSIAGTAEQVASASEELSSTSQEITANSEETSTQAQVVSSSSEQVNKNLQTVATGSEEMSASIKEIAKNAHESAKVATSAVRVADETNQIVAKLGDSSTEIGQVIKVITSIAQQTNLLALNATIEAARAGEAGKGFAVVANEVKELAKQTAKATEDISRKIEAIQGDTKSAVAAIGQIGEVIKQVNDISNTIATAVEEQNATTNEMARNVSEAARGSSEITKNISGVAQAAQSTAHGAGDSSKAAGSLAEMSTRLRELVAQFRLEKDAYAEMQARPQTPKTMSARAGA